MSTPLINTPKGLVSLLGLRDMGGVPRTLLADLQAGVDITQFLLLDREVLNDTVAVSTVTAAVVFQVPAGELWYVHEYGIRSSALAASERIKITTITQPIIGGFSIPNGTTGNATNTGERAACHFRDSIWLNPGGTLGYQVLDIATAGTITLTPTILISRLRI
jgi:hypothetical protein